MKKIIIFVLLAMISVEANSQYKVLKLEKDTSLTRILNSISFYKTFHTSELAITIFVVTNESGTAKIEGTDEVSEKVYIGVSEYDENPKQMLYSIDNLIAPKDFIIVEKKANNTILKFTYGFKLKPSFAEIKITNEGLTKLKL